MSQFLKHLFDLVMFRGHPQHLPGTQGWLAATAVTALISETLVENNLINDKAMLLANLLNLLIFAGLVWILLRAMSHSPRWFQTMIAIFGAQTVLNLLTIPFAGAIGLEMVSPSEFTIQSKSSAMILTILMFWSLFVTANIFRLATDSGFIRSLITVILLMGIAMFITLLVVQGFLPAPQVAE